LLWIDKLIQENGKKGQEPRENKPLLNKENSKKQENQIKTHLKIGFNTTIQKKITILFNDFVIILFGESTFILYIFK
jgi:hypothetical protein